MSGNEGITATKQRKNLQCVWQCGPAVVAQHGGSSHCACLHTCSLYPAVLFSGTSSLCQMPLKAGQLRTGLRFGGCSHVETINKLRRPKAGPFFGNDLLCMTSSGDCGSQHESAVVTEASEASKASFEAESPPEMYPSGHLELHHEQRRDPGSTLRRHFQDSSAIIETQGASL